jgi:hypothetical protein
MIPRLLSRVRRRARVGSSCEQARAIVRAELRAV